MGQFCLIPLLFLRLDNSLSICPHTLHLEFHLKTFYQSFLEESLWIQHQPPLETRLCSFSCKILLIFYQLFSSSGWLQQSRSPAFNFFRTRDLSRMVERVWFEEFSMEKNLGKWRDLKERLLRMRVEISATCGWYFRHSGHAAVKGEGWSANVKRNWSPCSDFAHFTLSHLDLPSLKGSLPLHPSNISPSSCHFTLHVAGYTLPYSIPIPSFMFIWKSNGRQSFPVWTSPHWLDWKYQS